MATQQDDIKRMLAYSTLSQLGLMVAALGLGVPEAASVSSFYSRLFQGASCSWVPGSVIISLHHEQNIWQMGGLQRKMPITFWTFLIGALALAACPPLAGFWSKDGIVASAFDENIFAALLIALVSFFTAYYMARLFVVAFLGPTSIRACQPRPGIASGNDACPWFYWPFRRDHRFPLIRQILPPGSGTRRRAALRDRDFARGLFGRQRSRIHVSIGKNKRSYLDSVICVIVFTSIEFYSRWSNGLRICSLKLPVLSIAGSLTAVLFAASAE